MSERTLHDRAGRPGGGASRAHVLDLLRAMPDAVGVREIAERTGLHPNTARFHLDTLADEGLAERATQGHGGPGRPRIVYRAAAPAGSPVGRRSYQLLAQMLTGLVTQALPHPAQAAVDAGEAWGRYLAETPAPDQRIDSGEAVRRLTRVLAEAGFAPGPVRDAAAGDGTADGSSDSSADTLTDPVIPLRHCPFREVAEDHRDVVCSLHLGLMRGTLKEVRAPLDVDRLEPFVEPSLCLAHLTPADAVRSAR